MWISIKLAGGIYRLVSVYSPCEGSNVGELDKFYEELGDIAYRKGSECFILLGDFNAE